MTLELCHVSDLELISKWVPNVRSALRFLGDCFFTLSRVCVFDTFSECGYTSHFCICIQVCDFIGWSLSWL